MKRRFIIYGLLGWCIEVFWTGFGSLFNGNIELPGKTYIWMFPIYGLAVLLEPIHNRIRQWPVILRGGIYVVFIFIIEYATGLLLREFLGACPWNYDSSYAVDGLIRLDYTPAWFVAGLLFEKIHDKLLYFENLIEIQSYRRTL